MKNIRNYCPDKYNSSDYQKVEENIYKTFQRSNLYVGIKDKKVIRKLKKSKNWELSNDGFYYVNEYKGTKYYIPRTDYERKNLSVFYVPAEVKEIYVTSLMFEQEPEFGENQPSDKNISQYPLEDILDKFKCYCNDFYDEENESDSKNSYQEFASEKLDNIRNLTSIIGKHVYNKEEQGSVKLVIE